MKSILRQLPSHGREMHRKWGDMEAQLNQKLENCKEEVHTALCGITCFYYKQSVLLFY